jgi:putative hemolysin
VGEITSEAEIPEPEITRREDGSYLLDGLLDIDKLKELLAMETLPEEDHVGYQTLGGFVMNQLGSVPKTGQHFHLGDHHFEIVDMDGHRVDKVLVTSSKHEDLDSQPGQVK